MANKFQKYIDIILEWLRNNQNNQDESSSSSDSNEESDAIDESSSEDSSTIIDNNSSSSSNNDLPDVLTNNKNIWGLMLTDVLCDKELDKYKSDDLLKLKTKYNTVLSLLDLQRNTRNYVDWARDSSFLTELGLKNINKIKSYGYELHVILLNSWAATNGHGAHCGGIKRNIKEEDLYTSSQLSIEKAFIDNLLLKCGNKIDGIMPLLEGTDIRATKFSIDIAEYLRVKKQYKGRIVFNLLGAAKSELSKYDISKYDITLASSIGTEADWMKSNHPIRNADGMQALTEGNITLIEKLTGNPGSKGFYLWSKDLVGFDGKRIDNISDNWLKHAKQGVVTPPTPPTPPNPPTPPSNETPEQRHKRLYPHVQLTGGNAGTATNHTLWKPHADDNGKLVVVMEHDLPQQLEYAITSGGKLLESKTIKDIKTAGNGYRLNARFSKPGEIYGKNIVFNVKTVDGVYSMSIPNGGARVDNIQMKKVSGGTTPIPPTPPTPPNPPVPPTGKIDISKIKIAENNLYLPAGYAAKRVIITKGYDANSFPGMVIARDVSFPAVIPLPVNFKTLPRTAAGELLIWIDYPIASSPYRQLEFWTNPDTGKIRLGEIWHNKLSPGGSFYKQQGFNIKMGSSSSPEYSRAYVV